MKIYEMKMAPNPRRVRIFVAEKRITVPFEQVDLFHGASKPRIARRQRHLGQFIDWRWRAGVYFLVFGALLCSWRP